MRHFLAYWKPQIADYEVERGGDLNHAASDRFDRTSPDDVVWIVTVRSGTLFLIGRIVVDLVANQETAEQVLGTTDLFEADYHVVAAAGTEMPVRNIEIGHLAGELRFESRAGRSRLDIADGRVNGQQLQQMRVLTPDSAAQLQAELLAWTPVGVSDGVSADHERYFEGSVSRMVGNVYERNAAARRACIEHYGSRCRVCGFDFEAVFGELGHGYIHVHHLTPLSQIAAEHELDPIRDLRPVCPNCHAMLHIHAPDRDRSTQSNRKIEAPAAVTTIGATDVSRP